MATVPIMMLPLVKYIQKEVLSWRAIVGAFVAVGGVAILFLR
jgi:drug/metabolite transporter (DMT)-like permease